MIVQSSSGSVTDTGSVSNAGNMHQAASQTTGAIDAGICPSSSSIDARASGAGTTPADSVPLSLNACKMIIDSLTKHLKRVKQKQEAANREYKHQAIQEAWQVRNLKEVCNLSRSLAANGMYKKIGYMQSMHQLLRANKNGLNTWVVMDMRGVWKLLNPPLRPD